jgi:hypothetical protein
VIGAEIGCVCAGSPQRVELHHEAFTIGVLLPLTSRLAGFGELRPEIDHLLRQVCLTLGCLGMFLHAAENVLYLE